MSGLRFRIVVGLLAPVLAAAQTHWVATWAASPAQQLPNERDTAAAHLEFDHQTVREIVHASLGGHSVRVRLSNAYGRIGAEIGSAHIALRESGSSIAAGSDRTLTFGGRTAVTIPTDAPLLSDPVSLDIPAGADLAISLYLPQRINGGGVHYSAQQTSYIAPSDEAGRASLDNAATFTSWAFLTEVDVLAPRDAFSIVAFGDSITDGAQSGTDTNARWPDVLAARLIAGHKEIGVANAGIGGNRLLYDPAASVRFGVNALARFDRDVLSTAGVKYVIVLEGINDLGHAGSSAPASEAVTAGDLIAADQQIIARAHEHGIRVIGATLTPFAIARIAGYYTPEKDAERKKLNEWIRNGKAFDGVIDFERAVGDPSDPDRMQAGFDSGDHLHPKAAGYRAMGEAIDLALFR
jgi:lysophospholipase L1-like esterase